MSHKLSMVLKLFVEQCSKTSLWRNTENSK